MSLVLLLKKTQMLFLWNWVIGFFLKCVQLNEACRLWLYPHFSSSAIFIVTFIVSWPKAKICHFHWLRLHFVVGASKQFANKQLFISSFQQSDWEGISMLIGIFLKWPLCSVWQYYNEIHLTDEQIWKALWVYSSPRKKLVGKKRHLASTTTVTKCYGKSKPGL